MREPRCFVKMVKLPGDIGGINLLVFDFDTRVVCQQTPNGGQECRFEGFRYDSTSKTLSFSVKDGGQTMQMDEIPPALYRTLIRPDNWENLCRGLRSRSTKTIEWLRRKGIT